MTEAPIRYGEIAPHLPEGRILLDEVIPGSGPLELDIGYGRGRSVLVRAEIAPNSRIIGVEIKSKLAYQVDTRLARLGRKNARAFQGEILSVLARCEPNHVLRRVSIHFPDPWWKKRHAKRRVIQDPLLDQLQRLMVVGGELLVQTDVEDRAKDYQHLLEQHAGFDFGTDGGWIDANPFEAESNREVRAAQDGLPVYRLLAIATGLPDLLGGDQQGPQQ